jgi:hypothetical protein
LTHNRKNQDDERRGLFQRLNWEVKPFCVIIEVDFSLVRHRRVGRQNPPLIRRRKKGCERVPMTLVKMPFSDSNLPTEIKNLRRLFLVTFLCTENLSGA